jgi:hypothetical protein
MIQKYFSSQSTKTSFVPYAQVIKLFLNKYLAVVKKPKECTVCGTLCCEVCIKMWTDKNSKITNLNKFQMELNAPCVVKRVQI